MTGPEIIKALGLCSGGLDSILSALVLKSQGIWVEWITFETPFFSADKAKKASAMTGIRLHVINITDIYIEMLKNPRTTYGRYMNPCMDCHALMFRVAGYRMKEKGFSFMFSGEVLGQRPMSQTRPSLRYVEKNSGHPGYILRPLSALKLPETEPEKKGWVDRSRLLGISGRSRKEQMALAEKYGITEYPTPAGGCLLTDKGYSKRLKDLLEFKDNISERDLLLLRWGRHLKINEDCRLIIGRTKVENNRLLKLFSPRDQIMLKTVRYPGPVAILTGKPRKDDLTLCSAICAGYSKAPKGVETEVTATTENEVKTIHVAGISPSQVRHYLL